MEAVCSLDTEMPKKAFIFILSKDVIDTVIVIICYCYSWYTYLIV